MKRDHWAWVGVMVVVALCAALLFWGCGDKRTTRYIQQVLPVVEHPVDCEKAKLCRHGNICVPCEKDDDD